MFLFSRIVIVVCFNIHRSHSYARTNSGNDSIDFGVFFKIHLILKWFWEIYKYCRCVFDEYKYFALLMIVDYTLVCCRLYAFVLYKCFALPLDIFVWNVQQIWWQQTICSLMIYACALSVLLNGVDDFETLCFVKISQTKIKQRKRIDQSKLGWIRLVCFLS